MIEYKETKDNKLDGANAKGIFIGSRLHRNILIQEAKGEAVIIEYKNSEMELKDKRDEASQNIFDFSVICRRKVAGAPDHLETAEWSEKRLRALRVTNKTPLPGDIEKFEIEALHRNKGETAEELALKVESKAARFESASIIITGITAAANHSVESATTVVEVDACLEAFKKIAYSELAMLL
jgi:hypothetical protein